MTIIQLPQGHYRDLTGMPWTDAQKMFAQHDAEFLEKYPSCKPYHQPPYVEYEVKDTDRAAWGTEWYLVDADGRLKMHSAQYDSSG